MKVKMSENKCENEIENENENEIENENESESEKESENENKSENESENENRNTSLLLRPLLVYFCPCRQRHRYFFHQRHRSSSRRRHLHCNVVRQLMEQEAAAPSFVVVLAEPMGDIRRRGCRRERHDDSDLPAYGSFFFEVPPPMIYSQFVILSIKIS